MNPATMLTISGERSREMREQAAAWRSVREARGALRARSLWVSFMLIARNGWSLAGQKQPGDPAAA